MSSILEVRELTKVFRISRGMLPWNHDSLHAVDSVSFTVERGQTVGIAGESGCGKSTLAWCLMGLTEATSGSVMLNGEEMLSASRSTLKRLRKKIQMVFQDPYDSLNPRRTVGELISDPLRVQTSLSKAEIRDRVANLLTDVGLPSSSINKFPNELSGGQRQRVGIARALILDPEIVVADEAVASLDVSIQAQVLNLFADLQDERELSYIFITHDLSVLRHMADKVIIMYLGEIVEIGDNESIYSAPAHPYTKALLAAATDVGSDEPIGVDAQIKGEIPNPIDRPAGCPFAPRCPIAQDICIAEKPRLQQLSNDTMVACHFPDLGTDPGK